MNGRDANIPQISRDTYRRWYRKAMPLKQGEIMMPSATKRGSHHSPIIMVKKDLCLYVVMLVLAGIP